MFSVQYIYMIYIYICILSLRLSLVYLDMQIGRRAQGLQRTECSMQVQGENFMDMFLLEGKVCSMHLTLADCMWF